MRKIVLAISTALGMMTMSEITAAKVNVNVNINIQPNWGPSGYDYVSYYYLPEYNVYYNVINKKFHYKSGQRWVTAAQLPPQFGRVDLYRTYKVVINNQNNPYLYNDKHIRTYGSYKNKYNQITWRYYNTKYNTPKHTQPKGMKPNDRNKPGPGVAKNQGGPRR